MAAEGFVVGFDGSDGASAALRWAIETAVADGSTVDAVAAWSLPITPISPWGPVPAFDEGKLVAAYEQRLTRAIERARQAVPGAPPVELRVLTGFARPTLIEAGTGARLLVVGRRGHGGFAGLLLGSVADHCLYHGSGPLALVPPIGGRTRGAIVVGIDGSPDAGAALRWGAVEAHRSGRPLVALYAWSWLDQPSGFKPAFDERAATDFAAGIVGTTLGEQPATVLAVNELPARALLERSEAGDLVVVGSRGQGPITSAFLGSVSRELAHHAASTVVVVRPAP